MSLHIGDYIKDTGHLNALQHGGYLLLIMHYWTTGGLPDDDRQLATIARMTPREWKQCRPILEKFFRDGWRHKRVDFELAEAARISAAGRKAGIASAKARAARAAPECGDDRSTNARQSLQRLDGACATNCQPPTSDHQDVVVDDARRVPLVISAEACALAEEIAGVAGLRDAAARPPAWVGAALHVAKWLAAGWKAEVIRAAVAQAMQRKRDGPPASIAYFEKPIAAAHAALSAPLPVAEIKQTAEVIHVGGVHLRADRAGSVVAAALEMRSRLACGAHRDSVQRLPKG
jgi:uncharacterized protein YdaU (DUF1376 family)